MKKIVIASELMDLNNYINRQRANKYGGAQAKKTQTAICAVAVKNAMNRGLVIEDDELPLNFEFHWYAKNKRKDKDNIAFSKKFIFDGMVQAKLIDNDGWQQIGGWSEYFYVDRKRPRVEVIIHES